MMKCAAMTKGREHNLAAKDSFVTSKASKPDSIDLSQDDALSAARSHNLKADGHFDDGGQKATNLADKNSYAKGKKRPSGKFGA